MGSESEMSEGGTLAGVRVVDFGHYLPGPLLGMFLADNGADVISVVPPGGPRWDHPVNAALYRNKRTIEIDLKSAEGQAQAKELIDTADVVIENFRPGVRERLGLDPVAARERHPELTWCSITGFPGDHPLAAMRGWDSIVCAAVGLYPTQYGVIRSDPRYSALPYASTFAAFMAAHRTMGALIHRQRTGAGAHVEVSLYEATFQVIGTHAELPDSKDVGHPVISRVYPILLSAHQTSDGSWIMLGGTPVRGIQSFLDQYLPGFDLINITDEDIERLRSEFPRLLKTRTAAEWERIAQEEFGASFGVVLSTEQWLRDEHALSSESVVPVVDHQFGETTQAGFPVRLSDAKPRIRWGRGHEPETAKAAWTDSSSAFPDSARSSDSPELPLSGIRVLDPSILLAGPGGPRILAQYGADVIKIDDPVIAYEPLEPLTDGSYVFVGHRTANAGKRSIFLNLKAPRGQDVLRELIRTADVVHHNFTPESASRLGIGVEDVKAVNPAAIHSSVSLHSHGGFREGYRGHDILGQMISGVAERFGDETPQLAPFLINDNGTSHLSAFGVMLALFHRNRTGHAIGVNASLSRTSTLHQMPFMIDFAGATRDEPRGWGLGWSAENRFYKCQDGWIYLDNTSNDKSVAEAIRCGDGEGPSLAAGIEDRFLTMTVDDAVSVLVNAGCAAHRYVEIADSVWSDFALDHKYTAIEEHRGVGYAFGIGNPIFAGDGTRSETRQITAARPGMHTIEVLSELGLRDQVVDLLELRVVATGEGQLMTSTTPTGYWTSPAAARKSLLDDDGAARVAQEIACRTQRKNGKGH